MDPITVIGTAGALCNIIDVLYKTISGAIELRNQYTEADMTLLSLVSQLTALRAALSKIQGMTDSLESSLHHQLVMDLDVAISCCSMLVGKIDLQISELKNPNDSLDFQSRLKLVFGSKGIDDTQKMLEHQTNALTLLLTALSCENSFEQIAMLERSSTRKTMRQMQIDSESLFVHRDANSIFTRYTDKLSKLSVVFPFDRELLVSKVYERALRYSMKDMYRRKSSVSESFTTNENEQRIRSEQIDRAIKQDVRKLQALTDVALVGSSDSNKDVVLGYMLRDPYGRSSNAYRRRIYGIMLAEAKVWAAKMQILSDDSMTLVDRKKLRFILDYELNSDPKPSFDSEFGIAVSALWEDPCMDKLRNDQRGQGEYSKTYFLQEAVRIVQPGYSPTEVDLEMLGSRLTEDPYGLIELCFEGLNLRVLNVELEHTGIPKRLGWINGEKLRGIIFVVNFAHYTEEVDGCNRIEKYMQQFSSLINESEYLDCSFILILYVTPDCERLLEQNPLENYFPEYSGGPNLSRARKFMEASFRSHNRSHPRLYTPFMEDSTAIGSRSLHNYLGDILREAILFDNSKDSKSSADTTGRFFS